MTISNDANPDVSALTEKFRKFGVLGASVIRDPTGVSQNQAEAKPVEKKQQNEDLSLEQVIQVLKDNAEWNIDLRKAVTKLLNSLYSHPQQCKFSFLDIYREIEALNFPNPPHDVSDFDLNQIVLKYQEDPTIQEPAENYLRSQQPDFDRSEFSTDAQAIEIDTILTIHGFMNETFLALVADFAKIPETQRYALNPRLIEHVAEIKIGLENFNKFGHKAELLEAAVALKQEQLEVLEKYQGESGRLAETMKELHSFTKPRISRAELISALNGISQKSEALKVLAKKLRKLPVTEGYARFLTFSEEQMKQASLLSNPFEAKDLVDRHLRSCADGQAKEIKDAWENSGLELSMFMQACIMLSQDPSMGAPPPPPASFLKKKNLPSAEDVLLMQETMVTELGRISQEILAVAPSDFQAEPLVAFAQAVASAAVEDKFGVSAETLTLAGFKHGMTMMANPRFVEISQEQQRLLGEIAQAAPGGEGQPGQGGCVVM